MQWRCIVCGKKFNGEKPNACPLCGVESKYIVAEEEYKRPEGQMPESSWASFQRALNLEIEATRIYEEAAKKAQEEGDQITALFFEALAKNEKGHQVAIKYQQACRQSS